MKVSSIQPTPNPNAFKFLTDAQLAPAGKNKQFGKAEDAGSDELAKGMFGVEGVETLFFCENFVTVSMTPSADWRGVAEQITRLLENHVLDEATMAANAAPGTADPNDEKPEPVLPKGGDPEMIAKINELLDDRVRPALAGDGGGLEIIGLEEKTLYIRYQGACGSCPSSTAGTLMAIQNLVQSEIDEELVVAPS
ncbi:MAG: NifU family protein [bacterium]|nr:NifU family protein [bacterium]